MTISWRLTGDRNVAAEMRGEARRVMFHLDQYSKDVAVNALNRIYPDGSQVTVYKFFNDYIVIIDGVSIPAIPITPPKVQGEVIIFYSKSDGTSWVAVADVALLNGGGGIVKTFPANTFNMSFDQSMQPIFAKRFTYKTQDVWYYRLPFILNENFLFSGFGQLYGQFADYLYVESTGKWYLIKTPVSQNSPFNIGNYIYLFNGSTEYAFDFNFDTEALTTIKQVNISPGYSINNLFHIDNQGQVYYCRLTVDFFDWSGGLPFGGIG